ncbi:hypothetical protein ACJ41O_005718 [Fusarium nematophilum]
MAAGNNDRGNAIEGSQATASAARSNGGRAQTVLRTMLQETSSHLMSEQKQMLERLWGALMENQNKATKVMSNQLETFGRLEQEIRSIRAEAAEDRKKTEELRRMHEQTADELRAVREETAGQLRQMREQMNGQLGQARQQTVRRNETATGAARRDDQKRHGQQCPDKPSTIVCRCSAYSPDKPTKQHSKPAVYANNTVHVQRYLVLYHRHVVAPTMDYASTERKRSQAPSERQRRRWRKQRLASLRLGNVMLKPAPDSTSTFTLYQKHIHSQVSGRQEAGDTCHR